MSTTSNRELTVRPPFLACEGIVTIAVKGSIDGHVAGHVAIRAVARGRLETRSRLKNGFLHVSIAAGNGNLELLTELAIIHGGGIGENGAVKGALHIPGAEDVVVAGWVGAVRAGVDEGSTFCLWSVYC